MVSSGVGESPEQDRSESRPIRPKSSSGVEISGQDPLSTPPPLPSCGHHPTLTTSSACPSPSTQLQVGCFLLKPQCCALWVGPFGLEEPPGGRAWSPAISGGSVTPTFSTGLAHLNARLLRSVRERCGLRRRGERKGEVPWQGHIEENKVQLRLMIMSSGLCVDAWQHGSELRERAKRRGGWARERRRGAAALAFPECPFVCQACHCVTSSAHPAALMVGFVLSLSGNGLSKTS